MDKAIKKIDLLRIILFNKNRSDIILKVSTSREKKYIAHIALKTKLLLCNRLAEKRYVSANNHVVTKANPVARVNLFSKLF
ncbi:MAG: hypothetical protein V1866_04440 [archaeon]